eukprot:2368180-Rhodomonas_salina.1
MVLGLPGGILVPGTCHVVPYVPLSAPCVPGLEFRAWYNNWSPVVSASGARNTNSNTEYPGTRVPGCPGARVPWCRLFDPRGA